MTDAQTTTTISTMSTVKAILFALFSLQNSLAFPKASLYSPTRQLESSTFYFRAINNDRQIELNDDNDKEIGERKKLIECNASLLLPFSADVAFDAFSDLTRQPSWCKYLKSVEYIGYSDNERATDSKMPLRESKWTVSVKGLSFR